MHTGPLRDGLPVREAPLCRQQSSTAPRAHSTGALLFFIHGVQSRFPDIFHTLQPCKTHTTRETGGQTVDGNVDGDSWPKKSRFASHTSHTVCTPALKNTTQEVAVHSAAPRAAKKPQTQIKPLFSANPSSAPAAKAAALPSKERPHPAGRNPTLPPSRSGVTDTGKRVQRGRREGWRDPHIHTQAAFSGRGQRGTNERREQREEGRISQQPGERDERRRERESEREGSSTLQQVAFGRKKLENTMADGQSINS